MQFSHVVGYIAEKYGSGVARIFSGKAGKGYDAPLQGARLAGDPGW